MPRTILARAPLAAGPHTYLSKAVAGHADIVATVDQHLITAYARHAAAVQAAQDAAPAGA